MCKNKLRVCAKCWFIYKRDKIISCPMCGAIVSHSALCTLGKNVSKLYKSQKLYKDRKISGSVTNVNKQILDSN